MKLKSFSLRWLWLAAGIAAILGITGMNVYSLYQLRNNSIETQRKSKTLQVIDFADRTRNRFLEPFYGIGALSIKKNAAHFNQTGRFADEMNAIITRASADSIYENIYYIPAGADACFTEKSIFRFDAGKKQFIVAKNYGSVVCDALGMARTRMRALIEGYQFNNKVLFDTHRSFTIGLVNLSSQSVTGYLVMPVNRQFLMERYLQPQLEKTFGQQADAGISVWLRDWTQQKVLASSDPDKVYNFDLVQYIHQFPDFFDDWRLYVAMDEAMLASTPGSFVVNLVLLGLAFILLIGAMIFMFLTARREKALVERQSEFLANVTHELKTPLAVMQAAGENLADGRIKNQTRLRKYGSHIYSEALRLRQMIEKLLDAAHADADNTFVKPKPISVDRLIIDFIEEHRVYIEGKGFTIEESIDRTVPKVMLDVHSFNTILNNLVSNAIKYSGSENFLKISLSKDDKNIILQVEDHGIGIASESYDQIFEKFYRVEDSLTAQTKGYGLGLSIVKKLVELNTGTIEVKSKKGRGTIFIVKFPVLAEPIQSQTEQANASKSTNEQPISYVH